jgi:hypothetical protein
MNSLLWIAWNRRPCTVQRAEAAISASAIQIAHRRMAAGRETPRNQRRNNNSPGTSQMTSETCVDARSFPSSIRSPCRPPHLQWAETAGTTSGPYADVSDGHYEGRTACRKPASFAVALYWGIGSGSLNALVNAFDRLHMVRGWNSSCTG